MSGAIQFVVNGARRTFYARSADTLADALRAGDTDQGREPRTAVKIGGRKVALVACSLLFNLRYLQGLCQPGASQNFPSKSER